MIKVFKSLCNPGKARLCGEHPSALSITAAILILYFSGGHSDSVCWQLEQLIACVSGDSHFEDTDRLFYK